jgi:GT2 family glycosyltransferase
MRISIIIPVYKNIDLFLGMMRNNWKYIHHEEVIVVDDASGESLRELLEKEFEGIKVIVNEKNLGFPKTVNRGIRASTQDFIMLLNSDVKMIDDTYRKAIGEFADDKLFALSFIQIEKDKKLVGKNEIYFDRGFYNHRRIDDNIFGETGWAEGGSALFDAKKLKKLGGFDEMFSPFYWEDIDLSHRAKEMGWKIWFYPTVKVEHHHESTIGKYHNSDKIKTIALRNQFIFTWKNLNSSEKLIQHIFYTLYYLIANTVKANMFFARAFFWALKIKYL